MGWQVALSMGSLVWKFRYSSFNLDALLALDCRATGVTLKRSSILHSYAGRGLLAHWLLENGSKVKYY